jgi:hypothetical protein
VTALATALTDEAETRAAQTRASAITRFAWPASAKAMRAIYEAALA